MDIDIGVEDVGVAALQELWSKVALLAVELVSESVDVVLEKESFKDFSRTILLLVNLLEALKWKKIEAAIGVEATESVLHTLNCQLEKAHKIITDYRCESHLRLLLQSHSMLQQMQNLAREIAITIATFQMGNLNLELNLRATINQIVENLNSMEFRSMTAIENLASELEDLRMKNKSQESIMKLLEKIAQALGARANAPLVQKELELLKLEKEEKEETMKQAEASHQSQRMQLLYDMEVITRPNNEKIALDDQQYTNGSFLCPLCNETMTDPVAISCGHCFERKAIQEYFERGERTCPTCREELSSIDLTPNSSLRNSIEEWKEREMDLTFRAALAELNSDDISKQNKALEEIQCLLMIPRYTVKAADGRLTAKLVNILKDDRLNSTAALKCLYHLAKGSDQQKEVIAEAGAIRRIVKRMGRGETKPDDLAVLLELSGREVFGEKIGHYRDCIPLLVYLVNYGDLDISQKALRVLQNLSFSTEFIIKMAEEGYFLPFVNRFNEGPLEVREQMAAELINMELKENDIEELKDELFIQNLVQMLSSSSSECKIVCMKSIKKLISCPEAKKHLLVHTVVIPLLLGIISYDTSSPNLQAEASESIILLIKDCQNPEFQLYRGLHELGSEDTIVRLLKLATNSHPQTRVPFLRLLVELSFKSDMVCNLIKSDVGVITKLFSILKSEQLAARLWVMKLIYCMSKAQRAGVALPPYPTKETAIRTLADILKGSHNAEERCIAAGIISHLPFDDILVDKILCKSGALKAIREVICNADDDLNGVNGPANICTSLLENALAALLRYTEPTKPELQKEVGELELYPSLIRLLSNSSSLAKQRIATALAKLSQSTSLHVSDAAIMETQAKRSKPLLGLAKLFPSTSRCFSSKINENICFVHGTACSPRQTFCLVKTDALKPLLRNLSENEPGMAEAALMALETLLADQRTVSCAASVIVDNHGVAPILQVLEKGPLSAKDKALDIFLKILKHTEISGSLDQRSERVLVQLLQDNALKKKAANALKQMKTIPNHSYF